MKELKTLISRLLTGAKSANKKLFFALAGIAALGAFILNNSISQSAVSSQIGAETAAASTPDLNSESAAAGTPVLGETIEKPQLFIHLVGEVLKPGIYAVESGSRVIDALVEAGGFTKVADQSSINLARPLTDGEQIFVLKKGIGGQGGTSSINTSSSGSQSVGALISLNRGSQAELEQLPGVGPTLAQRIIDWRSANGGFKSKLDLQNVAGIGDKMFAAIEPKVAL